MIQQVRDALARSRSGFFEIRLERSWSITVGISTGRVEAAKVATDEGVFVRCLARGRGWGTATCVGLEGLADCVAAASDLAKVISAGHKVSLADTPAVERLEPGGVGYDPRGLSLDRVRASLSDLDAAMRRDRRVALTRSAFRAEVTEKWFGNTDGTLIHDVRSDWVLSGTAVARQGGAQESSVFSRGGRGMAPEWEQAEAPFSDVSRRAVEKLAAPRIARGEYPVILDPALAGLLVHQGLGHLLEADTQQVDGWAARAAAPGSRVASDLVTVADDGRAPGLRASDLFDDEGTETRNNVLVRNGVVVSRLHTRETAAAFSEPPTGSARALTYRHPPIVRLTNTYLAKGVGTMSDLLDGVDGGLYLCDASGSNIRGDYLELAAADAFRVRRGELAERVKGAVIADRLIGTLNRIDMVAGDFAWNQHGGGCSKGGQDPLPVSEGAPHLRISTVTIGKGET